MKYFVGNTAGSDNEQGGAAALGFRALCVGVCATEAKGGAANSMRPQGVRDGPFFDMNLSDIFKRKFFRILFTQKSMIFLIFKKRKLRIVISLLPHPTFGAKLHSYLFLQSLAHHSLSFVFLISFFDN